MLSSLSMNECHRFAQKLNNSAALCIEIGHYDRAIFSLTKALRLSRQQSDESLVSGCACHQCSLDGCIAYSENSSPAAKLAVNPVCKDFGCGFVYRRPIRVPPMTIRENHGMGRTLFLIITFNLAMAHHLDAMGIMSDEKKCESKKNSSPSPNASATKIKKALQLYELSNNWHSRTTSGKTSDGGDPLHPSDVTSIRFIMIVSNNLSHIHRLSSNYTKHRQCLEHLLSTVMVAVDYNTRTSNGNSNDAISKPSTVDVDGFLMNASRLFMKDRCAQAA
eukprot:CAMPEP_0201225228 /NCGR_PEP_ID=MMETSP0851-20130426/194011_1 /ASSEMBLY_ACC=CAM_ASM_000631 /TAXON_ID=183588 /ORGANISM="Pseudo-nitzschia fraudulenta, Strain WWA7" /LENGTH=276 /DNA_ID=CAMNT_0047514997 /DNA_START=165 /DNA_END=995 /DNA_ORIENTATION=-